MKHSVTMEVLLYTASVGMSVLLVSFFICATWIGYEAKVMCRDATRKYNGDCVEALTVMVNDEHQEYRARNNAIWALGQFGDARALSVLEENYTGQIPSREPLDEMISQYELKKAIELTKGSTNISALIWRSLFKQEKP